MKISVVITLYNRANKVINALESILQQTYTDYEVIIVDDGSSDNPQKVLLPYLNKKNITYIQQENLGPAGAKNRGAKESSGEYIIFLDSDDWFDNNLTLETIAQSLKDNIDFIAFNKIRVITKDKEIINYYNSKENLIDEIMRYPLNYAACPPYVFKRNLFLDTGGFNLEFKWGDALLFWRKYLPKATILIIDDIGYVYDQRGEDSVSRKKDDKYLSNVFYTLDKSYSILREQLIKNKINKEWELVILGISIKRKKLEDIIVYFKRLFSNNVFCIPSAVYYILNKRLKK